MVTKKLARKLLSIGSCRDTRRTTGDTDADVRRAGQNPREDHNGARRKLARLSADGKLGLLYRRLPHRPHHLLTSPETQTTRLKTTRRLQTQSRDDERF